MFNGVISLPVVQFVGFVVRNNAYFGMGSGPILLSDLYCTGAESSLFECNRYMYGTLSCTHRDDAGVTCEGYHYKYSAFVYP